MEIIDACYFHGQGFLFIRSYVKMNSKVDLTCGFGLDNITEIAKQNC